MEIKDIERIENESEKFEKHLNIFHNKDENEKKDHLREVENRLNKNKIFN